MLIEGIVLRNVSDVSAQGFDLVIKRLAVKQYRPAGRRNLAADGLSNVLLPHPLAPITQTISPRFTGNEIPSRATSPPRNRRDRSCTSHRRMILRSSSMIRSEKLHRST